VYFTSDTHVDNEKIFFFVIGGVGHDFYCSPRKNFLKKRFTAIAAQSPFCKKNNNKKFFSILQELLNPMIYYLYTLHLKCPLKKIMKKALFF